MTNETKKKIKQFFNHERYELIAAIVCIGLVFYGVSCESTVSSLSDPQLKVTRTELSTEIENYIAQAERKFIALDRQDEFKVLLFDKVMLWTSTGVFNPMGILPMAFTILGIGAVTDNVRLRKKEKDANKKNP